jgi:hypothetical protein
MNGGETIQYGDALEGTVFTAEPKKETPDGVLDYIRSTGETELADKLKSKPSTILKFTTVPWCTVVLVGNTSIIIDGTRQSVEKTTFDRTPILRLSYHTPEDGESNIEEHILRIPTQPTYIITSGNEIVVCEGQQPELESHKKNNKVVSGPRRVLLNNQLNSASAGVSAGRVSDSLFVCFSDNLLKSKQFQNMKFSPGFLLITNLTNTTIAS